MTDARLPERLLMDRRVNRLPAEAWRSYTHSLMWSVSNRTDGIILRDDLPLIPMFKRGDEHVLTNAGLWHELGDRWKIDRFDMDQTTRAQLEAADKKRAVDRARKRRDRQKKSQDEPSDVQPDVQPDVHADVHVENKGQARTGQARPGQDQTHPAPQRFDHEDEGDGEQYFTADFNKLFGRKSA